MSNSTEVTIPSENVELAKKLEAPAIVDRLLEIHDELKQMSDQDFTDGHNNIRHAAYQIKIAIGHFVTMKK